MAEKKSLGLLGKYNVERIDDDEGKHDGCRYFVLDPQHDPIARIALAIYASEARGEGYGPLADDIADWLEEVGSPDWEPLGEDVSEHSVVGFFTHPDGRGCVYHSRLSAWATGDEEGRTTRRCLRDDHPDPIWRKN